MNQPVRIEGVVHDVDRRARTISVRGEGVLLGAVAECSLHASVTDDAYQRVLSGDWVSMDGFVVGAGFLEVGVAGCTINKHEER